MTRSILTEARIQEVIKHVVYWGSELHGYNPTVFMSRDLIDLIINNTPMVGNKEGYKDSFMGFPLKELEGMTNTVIIGL